MNKQQTIQLVFLCTTLLLLLNITSLRAESTASYTLVDSVISNGGGTSSAGRYRIFASVGQQTIGISSGGDYTIFAGYWANIDSASNSKIYLPLVQR